MKPHPFQVRDQEILRENNYRALLNMETGAGKTAAGVFAIGNSGASTTLIVAPDNTHATAWIPTIQEITGQEARIAGNRNKATKQALADLEWQRNGIYIVTPQFLTRADTAEWGGDLLIVDEVHMMAAPKSAGQRKLSGFDRRDDPINARFDGILALSGTALRNKFELAWSHSRLLWPELYRRGEVAYDNFYVWQADRMDFTEIITGMQWTHPWDGSQPRPKYVKRIDGELWVGEASTAKKYLGEATPGQWIKEAPCVITHYKRRECCEFHPNGFLDLDEPQVLRDRIELIPDQKKAIKELDNHMMTWLDDNPLVTEIPLTKAQRIRELILGVPTVTYDEEGNFSVDFADDCKSPFLDRLIERLTGEFADENVVVYTSSAKFATVTAKRLNAKGIPAFEFSGSTRGTRNEMLAEFGSKYRVVVGVIAAVGTGTDGLQRVSNTEIWLNRSTDETDNSQTEGRTDRLGATKQVQRVYLEDDLGIHEGRMSEQVTRKLQLAKSLQKR